MNTLVPGTHASTFGGNPVACAGGIVVVDKVYHRALIQNHQYYSVQRL